MVTIGLDCAAAPDSDPEIAPEFEDDWDSAALPVIIAAMTAAVQSLFISVCPILQHIAEGRVPGPSKTIVEPHGMTVLAKTISTRRVPIALVTACWCMAAATICASPGTPLAMR